MGCANSKIENEETVLRCKERKQIMKEAVTARNAFAAAHSAYVMSLKNTGAALSDYAHGEISSSSAAASTLPSAAVSHPHYDTTLPPPPPPLPNFSLQRATSMPEIKSVHKATANLSETVIEEGEEGEVEDETEDGLRHRPTRSSGGGGVFAMTLPPRNATRSDRTPPPPPQEDSKGVLDLDLDYIFLPMENMAGPSLAEVDHEGSVKDYSFSSSFLFFLLKSDSTTRSEPRPATSSGRSIVLQTHQALHEQLEARLVMASARLELKTQLKLNKL